MFKIVRFGALPVAALLLMSVIVACRGNEEAPASIPFTPESKSYSPVSELDLALKKVVELSIQSGAYGIAYDVAPFIIDEKLRDEALEQVAAAAEEERDFYRAARMLTIRTPGLYADESPRLAKAMAEDGDITKAIRIVEIVYPLDKGHEVLKEVVEIALGQGMSLDRVYWFGVETKLVTMEASIVEILREKDSEWKIPQ